MVSETIYFKVIIVTLLAFKLSDCYHYHDKGTEWWYLKYYIFYSIITFLKKYYYNQIDQSCCYYSHFPLQVLFFFLLIFAHKSFSMASISSIFPALFLNVSRQFCVDLLLESTTRSSVLLVSETLLSLKNMVFIEGIEATSWPVVAAICRRRYGELRRKATKRKYWNKTR